MIIISKDTCAKIDTENTLLIEYDYIGERLYAVVVKGQASMRVTLVEGIDEDVAWAIIVDIAKQESLGEKIYKIKSYQND